MAVVYPIRFFGDTVLRRSARELGDFSGSVQVPAFESVSLEKLAENMLETMYAAHGVGLAAPQIGVPLRMFVAAEYDDEVPEGQELPLKQRVIREFVMVNPELEVLDATREAKYLDGCLSLPGIAEEGVFRERAVRVHYQDVTGERRVVEADDYLARVFQHEADHLDGKLFLDYLPRSVMEKYRVELAEFQRQAKSYLKFVKSRM